MRIAICDDDTKDLQNLFELISNQLNYPNLEIKLFSAAHILYSAHKELNFDLVVLDIEMESPNGFDIAKEFKKEDSCPLIILVTNSMEYTVAGYGIAFRYIPKSQINEILIPSLELAMLELEKSYYHFEFEGTTHIIETNDISYIEIYNHNVTVHTLYEDYRLRDSISNVYSELPQSQFGMPHQSYIVNYSYISKLTPQEIRLTTGVVIPVSRRKSLAFNKAFHNYLRR